MSQCCVSGFKWEGKPLGKETKLAGNAAYVAIMIVHDVFGWTLPNVRLLADHYAKEADATVYLPDFFDGEIVSTETFDDPKKRQNLVDCISTAHPSALTKEEIDAVAVPVQILASEHDPQFTPELKEYVNKVIPSLNVEYDYQYFPGLIHGFAVRGDQSDPKQKLGLERAKNAAVGWFAQMLHLH
ncbi:hypothetical protein P7C71_g2104, partial [Lecanoromycetidae sp. Uapishka_2]